MCCSIHSKGGLEMVAECVGRDVDGQRIVCFLVVSNFWIYRHWESGELIQSQYPEALASCKYVRKAFVNDTLPVPSPIFPVPFYPDDLVIPPLLSDLLLLILLLYLPIRSLTICVVRVYFS